MKFVDEGWGENLGGQRKGLRLKTWNRPPFYHFQLGPRRRWNCGCKEKRRAKLPCKRAVRMRQMEGGGERRRTATDVHKEKEK